MIFKTVFLVKDFKTFVEGYYVTIGKTTAYRNLKYKYVFENKTMFKPRKRSRVCFPKCLVCIACMQEIDCIAFTSVLSICACTPCGFQILGIILAVQMCYLGNKTQRLFIFISISKT